jgi:hypothetical protein
METGLVIIFLLYVGLSIAVVVNLFTRSRTRHTRA